MNEYQKRFVALLKTIFELDKSDLDFGIYRIINIRQREIVDYFENRLPKKIQEILAPFANGKTDEIKQKLAKIESDVESMGMTIDALQDNTPKKQEYIALLKQLSQGADMSALESDVYSALYSFFNRYYDEGDFISKRRYKEGVYAIPYEGEEVKLYWANQDQYYIKTAENFKDYSFVTKEGINVHFRLVDATIEQNNNKETDDSKRVFMLYTENDERPELKTFEWNAESKELIIRFIFDIPADKKKNYVDDNYAKIREYIIGVPELMMPLMYQTSTDPKKPITLIQKHLNGYVAKNTFDYFIHKDLGGFLTRELDFFIKNEVMHLDDLDTDDEVRAESYLAKVRAVKRIGKEIITFLAQIENFQRKLWLKKKFVVETNWCITLDHIDKSFYPEIIANKTQIQEWIDMYAIDEIKGDLNTTAFTNPPSIEFLKENQNLIVDTKNFPTTFRDRLIASIDNIDENTNGLMINGDNIQAISLLQKKYNGKIDCIHIDPPYNTDTSGFLYKNNFKHSSWISMMDNRINSSIPLMAVDGTFICHIDENEYENLWNLFNNTPLYNLGTCIWNKRNPMTGGSGIAIQHEYFTFFSRDNITISINGDNAQSMLAKVEELRLKYGSITDELKAEFNNWINSNPELSGGDKAYRNISDDWRLYQSVSLRAPEYRTDPKFHIPLIHPQTGRPCPVPPNGFSRTPETLKEMQDRGDIIFGADESTQPRYKMYLSHGTKKQLTSIISDAVKGTSDLKKMNLTFPYCHSLSFYDSILSSALSHDRSIVLDYFGGSGTTAHAIINDNRSRQHSN